MQQKRNSGFSVSLIISIALHVGLIAALGYSAWQYVSPYANMSKGDSIEAVVVDSKIISEQYKRQLAHQQKTEQVKQQQQKQIEQQSKELQEKQLAEQQRLKELAKESLLAQEKQQQEKEAAAKALAEKKKLEEQAAKAKADLEEQQKLALIAKQKSEEEAKLRAQKELEDKQRIAKEKQQAELAKQKALEEAEKAKQEAEKQKQILEQERLKAEKLKQEKLKAEQAAKQKAEDDAKSQKALDDILGGLTSTTPPSQKGVSSAEQAEYVSLITSAIQNKFINPNGLYANKTCQLSIQIAPDGLLLSVTAGDGDPILCREAVSATKLAKFPKPKNNLLYQQVKTMTITFKPN